MSVADLASLGRLPSKNLSTSSLLLSAKGTECWSLKTTKFDILHGELRIYHEVKTTWAKLVVLFNKKSKINRDKHKKGVSFSGGHSTSKFHSNQRNCSLQCFYQVAQNNSPAPIYIPSQQKEPCECLLIVEMRESQQVQAFLVGERYIVSFVSMAAILDSHHFLASSVSQVQDGDMSAKNCRLSITILYRIQGVTHQNHVDKIYLQ